MIEVLTIDDEPLALQQLEAYIRKIPFFHLVASCLSAKEAWEVMEQHTVDVMFCDINMPDINGRVSTLRLSWYSPQPTANTP